MAVSSESTRRRRPVVLRNITCPYCGRSLDPASRTKDHVVGRNFVPRGTLAESANLHVRACITCNRTKSDLENDISSISLLPAIGGPGPGDPHHAADLARKLTGSISRVTSKPVRDSLTTTKLETTFGSIGVKASFTGPPRIDEKRVYNLAMLQVQAFFYSLSYNKTTKKGGFGPGQFYPVLHTLSGDWGHPIHRTFMALVVSWEPWLIDSLARDFYKVAIRKDPNAEVWSWALEWNKNVRVIGFCGDREKIDAIVTALPPVPMSPWFMTGDGNHIRFRTEVALAAEDDLLFLVEAGVK